MYTYIVSKMFDSVCMHRCTVHVHVCSKRLCPIIWKTIINRKSLNISGKSHAISQEKHMCTFYETISRSKYTTRLANKAYMLIRGIQVTDLIIMTECHHVSVPRVGCWWDFWKSGENNYTRRETNHTRVHVDKRHTSMTNNVWVQSRQSQAYVVNETFGNPSLPPTAEF